MYNQTSVEVVQDADHGLQSRPMPLSHGRRRDATAADGVRRRRTPGSRTSLAVVTGAFLASLGLFVLAAGGVITGGTAGLAILLLAAPRRWPFAAMFLAGEPAVRRPGDPRQGMGVHPAVGSCPRPWSRCSPRCQPHALGVDAHRARLRVPRRATCWPASASSWSSGTAPACGGFNVVALLCQERSACAGRLRADGARPRGRPRVRRGERPRLALASGGGRGPAEPRHRR